jgi:hypothetical protein
MFSVWSTATQDSPCADGLAQAKAAVVVAQVRDVFGAGDSFSQEPGLRHEEPGLRHEEPRLLSQEPGLHPEEPRLLSQEPGLHPEEP